MFEQIIKKEKHQLMFAILTHINKTKISHQTFAKMCDVSLSTIKKIESNDCSLNIETLLLICNKIGYNFKIDLVGQARKVNPVIASRNKTL